MPLSVTACTMTPSASTNTKNDTFTERAISITPSPRCAAAQAAHRQHRGAGQRHPRRGHPHRFRDREPGQRQRHDHQHEHRRPRRRPDFLGLRRQAQIPGEKQPEHHVHRATAASHGSAITSVNLANEILATWKASRLVRFDTGSSSEAALARWAVA